MWHYLCVYKPYILGLVLFHREFQEVNLPKGIQLVNSGTGIVSQQSESD